MEGRHGKQARHSEVRRLPVLGVVCLLSGMAGRGGCATTTLSQERGQRGAGVPGWVDDGCGGDS